MVEYVIGIGAISMPGFKERLGHECPTRFPAGFHM